MIVTKISVKFMAQNKHTKFVGFLCANNELTKIIIRKMPFIIASNNQLIRIKLIKYIKVIYSENITYERNITMHIVGRINKAATY